MNIFPQSIFNFYINFFLVGLTYLLFIQFSGCNKNYTSTHGFISSPNFPENYPNNVKCYYSVTHWNPASRIKLNFLKFNLGVSGTSSFDLVKIYDGNSINAPQLGQSDGYCGRNIPPPFTSTRNSILIVFSSDPFGTYSGFSATYIGKLFLRLLVHSLTSVFSWITLLS